jgi:ligand-binding sensor domain-containing protein/signal transduction histidine kinase/CheY-like chemotaxis protein
MGISGYMGRARWRGLAGLFFLAGLVLASPGMALDPERRVSQYSQDSWRGDDGLPQNSVLSLAQTRDGYLWLGTWEGLVRFDGARFVVFDKRNTPALRSHTIRALVEDAEGTLWVGTEQGLVTYREGRFERASGALAPLEAVKVVRLLVAEGVLWVGTKSGLWRVPSGGGAVRHYTVEDGLPDASISALVAGEAGTLWVGTRQGVARLSAEGVEGMPFAVPGPRPRLAVQALSRDSAGVLWVGTEVGLVSWDGTLARRFTVDEGLPENSVSSLYTDGDGALWVGTHSRGLVRRTEAGFSEPVPGEWLAEAEVQSMLEDRDGHLWVGSYSGLFRLSDGPFTTYGAPEGLVAPEGTVSAVLEDRRGTLWVGTLGGGLYRMEGGSIRRVGAEDGLPEKVIPALHEDAQGTLWVGTLTGVYRYDGGRFSRLPREQGGPQEVVTALLVDSRGDRWIGTASGLVRLHGGEVSVYGKKHGLNQPVIVMVEDAQGRVWFGSESGLLRWEGDKKGFQRFTQKDGLPGDVVLALLADPDGTVWVGTETGLARWREDTWVRFTVAQGLYDDAVFSLVSDGGGHLWMSSNKGVSRVSRRELEDVADGRRPRVTALGFDQRDGMRSAECNGNTQPSAWRSRDGRLWFTNIGGAIVVDPVRVSSLRPPPEVRIEEVRVQNQPVPVEGRVELPPGGSRLDIRFTAFTAVDAAKLSFRYRLVGHDDGWVSAETRSATYTGLRPGTYRFEVQAQGRDGQWTESVGLDVALEPKLWQRTGFWLLCVLGTGLLGVSVYLLRVGQLKAREQWLAERVQDRTRALARANEELEANMRTLRQTQAQLVQAGRMAAVGQLAAGVGHEINNPLAYIVSNLEHASEEADALARELGDTRGVGPRLREVSQALREALHGADRVRRIVRDLKTFSRPDDEKQGPVELHAVLDSAVKIAMGELRPRAKVARDYGDVPRVEGNEARLAQVFLNLLINAAQALPEGRAEANEVRLVTRVAPEGMVVAEVHDTGIGIAPEALGRIFDPFYTTKPQGVGTGLGLSLCHAYVTAMGGSISVESEPGKGSIFRVTLRRAARESGAVPAVPGQERRGAREGGALHAVAAQATARESRSMPAPPAQEWGSSRGQAGARESTSDQAPREQGGARESRATPAVQVWERGGARDSMSLPALPVPQERRTPVVQQGEEPGPGTLDAPIAAPSAAPPALGPEMLDAPVAASSAALPAPEPGPLDAPVAAASAMASPPSTEAPAAAASASASRGPGAPEARAGDAPSSTRSAEAARDASALEAPDARAAREHPLDPESPESASRGGGAAQPAPVRGRVLVVDDDALVSGAIRRTLSRENDVEVLVSARQALARLTEPELRYDVVLCDLMMPEMTGMDLFDALMKTAPRVAGRVVFITGGAFTAAARTFLDRVDNPRVEKPFDPETLRKLIRAEVARARGEASGRAA